MQVGLYSTPHYVKIVYGDTSGDLNNYVAARAGKLNGSQVGNRLVTMTDDQFRRFKTAGRRHASAAPKMTPDGVSYTRPDRTNDPTLNKWDVDRYQHLTGRTGPWGTHAATNRDHLLAHSENVQIYNGGQNPYNVTNVNTLKKLAWCVTISGNHHRGGSATYGGRVNAIHPQLGMTPRQYASGNPTAGAHFEMEAILEHKRDPNNRRSGVNKSTLRIEMVGAYAFLYKRLVQQGVMAGNQTTTDMLLDYLADAVANDDGKARA